MESPRHCGSPWTPIRGRWTLGQGSRGRRENEMTPQVKLSPSWVIRHCTEKSELKEKGMSRDKGHLSCDFPSALRHSKRLSTPRDWLCFCIFTEDLAPVGLPGQMPSLLGQLIGPDNYLACPEYKNRDLQGVLLCGDSQSPSHLTHSLLDSQHASGKTAERLVMGPKSPH